VHKTLLPNPPASALVGDPMSTRVSYFCYPVTSISIPLSGGNGHMLHFMPLISLFFETLLSD